MVQHIIKALATLTMLSDIIIALALLYFVFRIYFKLGFLESVLNFFRRYSLQFALFVAMSATLGSLFFSEIAKFTPCKLCWFQRIFMYPQVLILGIALFYKDFSNSQNMLHPMCVIGGFISIYKYCNYLQLFLSLLLYLFARSINGRITVLKK